MNTKEFFGKLANGYVWWNLLAMAVVVVLLCFGVKYGLEYYTHHGEGIMVPKVQGMTYSKARLLLEEEGLIIMVTDSGYNKTLPADCILAQTPGSGTKVKQGHIVYVTVNSPTSPSFTIPDIVDNSSVREAEAKLMAMGFRLLPAQTVPGEKDWVYGVLVGGKSVVTGSKISVEDSLVIQVGNGMRDASDSVNYIDPIYPEEEDAIDEFEVMDNPTTTTDKPETQATEKKTTTTE